MYVVKKLISGTNLKVGEVVDASNWPNVGALKRAGYLDLAPFPVPQPAPTKGRRKSEED